MNYELAAKELGCSVAAIQAVAEVESKGKPFLPSGEPVILFEPHIFSQLTNHKYDRSHPNLSYRRWKPGTYGPAGLHQHKRLQRAVALDRDAALQSASWGRFQVMGFNWKVCGYASLQAFINDMMKEDGQLHAFVGYVKGRNLADELQRLDWAGFAYGYNGSGYAVHHYDTKMAAAYKRYAK